MHVYIYIYIYITARGRSPRMLLLFVVLLLAAGTCCPQALAACIIFPKTRNIEGAIYLCVDLIASSGAVH